jgi:hypothetical protein
VPGGEIGHAGEYQRSLAAADHAVRIHQRVEAQPLELADPTWPVPVVLVVARNEELALRGGQLCQRCQVVSQVGGEPVPYVSGQRDHVRPQLVRPGHYPLHEVALQVAAYVQIGELNDPEALEVRGQLVDRDVDPDQRRPARMPRADDQEEKRATHRAGAEGRGAEPGAQVGQVARQDEHDQQR